MVCQSTFVVVIIFSFENSLSFLFMGQLENSAVVNFQAMVIIAQSKFLSSISPLQSPVILGSSHH